MWPSLACISVYSSGGDSSEISLKSGNCCCICLTESISNVKYDQGTYVDLPGPLRTLL